MTLSFNTNLKIPIIQACKASATLLINPVLLLKHLQLQQKTFQGWKNLLLLAIGVPILDAVIINHKNNIVFKETERAYSFLFNNILK